VAGNYGAPRDVEAALSKIDAGGGVAWTRLISTPSFDFLADVAVDAGGNAFAIGFTSGGGFVRKYSGEGDVLWTSPLDPSGGSVAVDSAGRSYVTSYTWPTLQVTRFDSGGAREWTRHLGENLLAEGIAIDPSGHAWVVGHTYSPDTASEGFVARIDEDGCVEWLTRFGIAGTGARRVAFDSGGNGYVVGSALSGSGDAFVARVDPAGQIE